MSVFTHARHLPFVRVTEMETLDMWSPPDIGDSEEASELGKQYAKTLMEMMTRTGVTITYANVMRAMIARGKWGPIERGFCMVFGIYAIGLIEAESMPPPSNVVRLRSAA